MAMEESKELQTAYKIFRSLIYVSVVLEFFMFALDPQILDFWNGIVGDIHGRMKQWFNSSFPDRFSIFFLSPLINFL